MSNIEIRTPYLGEVNNFRIIQKNAATIFLSSLVVLMGFVVLMGWYAGNLTLIQVLPKFVPMQYNTALCFLLCGISLFFITFNRAYLSIPLAGVFGVIGTITIFQYITGINTGLDELFMKHRLIPIEVNPGRMAPNTALCFILSSVAILLNRQNEWQLRAREVLGSLTFGLGLAAFIGYLIGAEHAYGWSRFTRMAVHTSFGFMLVGMAIITLSWNQGNDLRSIEKSNSTYKPWLLGYAATLALTIFSIDLSLPLGVAGGVPYVILILLGWYIPDPRYTIRLAILSSILTLLGYYFSPPGSENWIVMTNRSFAWIAIWVVASLIYIIKLRDLELKEANTRLDRKVFERTEELEIRNNELKQFAYIASHDLQEPLRTVINFTDLLGQQYKSSLDDMGEKYLDFISQASYRMSALIKGLLDYSRLGKNKRVVTVDCNKLVQHVIQDLNAKISETGTTFTVSNLPTLKGYETELRMLFQNLITNAIKFRRKKIAPSIHIAAQKNQDYWKLSFSDNGIGIAKEHRERIFTIFQRLHNKSEYEGTGIGLAHCNKVAELHGGKIWVESNSDNGSTFFVTIKH